MDAWFSRGGLAPEAHAQYAWSEEKVITGTSTAVPLGAAIRNWAPTGDVFIAPDVRDPTADTNTVRLRKYNCNPADCSAGPSFVLVDTITEIEFGNSSLPSMGIRRVSANDPIELTIATRDHLMVDASGDPLDCDQSGTLNIHDTENADLAATLWDTTNQTVELDAVSRRGAFACINHGLSQSRFPADRWACYTEDPDGKSNPDPELVECNDSPGPPTCG